MSRLPLVFACFGLVLSLVLWSVPGLVAASGFVSLVGASGGLVEQVGSTDADAASLKDALVGLMGAEVEAMQVAGVAIENPHTPNLGARADAAGNHVVVAVHQYVVAFEKLTSHPLPRF